MSQKIKKIINKKNVSKIVSLTAYSKNIAKILDKYCDIILVGDSMANVLYGQKNTHSLSLNNIIQHTGNALDVLKNLNEKYDIIFIDADKENYINYFNQVSNKLSKNGIIISDNVLWSGKVLDSNQMDEETSTLVQFNKIINDDKRFKSIILPIRDGISISRLV